MFSLCIFALLIKFSVQDMNSSGDSVHPATSKGESTMSGGNFIYFFGPPATHEQLRSIRQILKSDLVELDEMKAANPVRYLVKPGKVENGLSGEMMSQENLPHKHTAQTHRRRRHATYKKSGGGGGGGGCCNQCGQCGGGGGQSGSYSQSTSYSQSSSGSYGQSYGKKK